MDEIITKWLRESDENNESGLKSGNSGYDTGFFGGYALAKKECANELRRHLSEASTRPDDADAESEESELYDSNAYGAEWGDKSGG